MGLTCKSTLLEAVTKRFGGILSDLLYCFDTFFHARDKSRYFDADKQGSCEMLDTAGQDGNGHSAHRGRGPMFQLSGPWPLLTSLLDIYDEILVENETNEQHNSTASK